MNYHDGSLHYSFSHSFRKKQSQAVFEATEEDEAVMDLYSVEAEVDLSYISEDNALPDG